MADGCNPVTFFFRASVQQKPVDLGRRQATTGTAVRISSVTACAERLSFLPSLPYPPWKAEESRNLLEQLLSATAAS